MMQTQWLSDFLVFTCNHQKHFNFTQGWEGG